MRVGLLVRNLTTTLAIIIILWRDWLSAGSGFETVRWKYVINLLNLRLSTHLNNLMRLKDWESFRLWLLLETTENLFLILWPVWFHEQLPFRSMHLIRNSIKILLLTNLRKRCLYFIQNMRWLDWWYRLIHHVHHWCLMLSVFPSLETVMNRPIKIFILWIM